METFRRLVLTAVLTVVSQGSTEQAVVSVLVSIAFVKLYAFFAPYVEDKDDILAEVGQYQILFTFFGALIIQGKLVNKGYNPFIGGSLILINIGVVLVPLLFAVQEYQKYRENANIEEKRENKREATDNSHGLPSISVNAQAKLQMEGSELEMKSHRNNISTTTVNIIHNIETSSPQGIQDPTVPVEIRKGEIHRILMRSEDFDLVFLLFVSGSLDDFPDSDDEDEESPPARSKLTIKAPDCHEL